MNSTPGGQGLLVIANNLDGVTRAHDFFQEWCLLERVPDAVRRELHVVVDELLMNLLKHGYADSAPHFITLRADRLEEGVGLTLEEDGRPFDPVRHIPASIPSSPTERRPGGLGLRLVKSFVDELSYCRREGKNFLRLTRGFDRPGRPGGSHEGSK